tara:strand:- start:5707 stop:6474 length:768 start_codon:yes stop_codon:yes gene_type:complete
MTVFTETGTTQAEENTEQVVTEETSTEDFVDQLVKTKGENWKDPQVIAKGKIEGDRHIESLTSQIAEMREDLEKTKNRVSIDNQLQEKAGVATQEPVVSKNNNSDGVEADTKPDTTVDIEGLVEKTLVARERKAVVTRNIEEVNSNLEKTFGTEAAKEVQTRANELGMTMDQLQAIAVESPRAFFRLIGEAPAAESAGVVSGSVNTAAALNKSSTQDFEYYQNLRRTNSNHYYSSKMQNEMAESRVRLGDKFYRK